MESSGRENDQSSLASRRGREYEVDHKIPLAPSHKSQVESKWSHKSLDFFPALAAALSSLCTRRDPARASSWVLSMVNYDIAYDFHGQRLAVSTDEGLTVYAKGKDGNWDEMATVEQKKARVLCWAPPQFGQVLAAASLEDENVFVYEETFDTKSGAGGYRYSMAKKLSLESNPRSIAFKPGSEPALRLTLAVACADARVRVYKASDAMSLSNWKLESEFQLEGKADGATSADAKAGVVEGAGGGPPGVALAWNPNPFEIPSLVVGRGRALSIWEYYSQQQRWVKVKAFPDHESRINCISWAPSMGRSFHLIATGDRAVNIWKLTPVDATKAKAGAGWRFDVGTPNRLRQHQNQVRDVQWNVTGSILASSGDDGQVHLWKRDSKAWSALKKFVGQGPVRA